MNIYDFDGTIYEGDSSVDFFKYCVKINKKCLLILPKFILISMLYFLKIVEKEKLKSEFFKFVKYFDDINKIVLDFWKLKKYKLKDFYLKSKNKNDIVISASPEFLLNPVAKKYNFKLIATKVDIKTGKLLGSNCHGEEKVVRLHEQKINNCDKFYSDSLSDEPLSKIAKNAYIVKGNEIIEWKNYKRSFKEKVKNMFFSRDFITFVAIGVINAFNGIWIAYVYSLFIKNVILAYILGFFTSLIISYILNTKLNFKEKLNFVKFIKFIINNIPNFIIQILSVTILLNLLELPKIISYAISAVIAVPITFVLVKMFGFVKKK